MAPDRVRLLAIDVGTQSARAIVFDAQGHLLAKAQTPIPDLKWIPAPGVHPPNPADLQALLMPPAPANGPASGAPAPASSQFGPLPGPAPAAAAPPGPLPAEQGAGR